MNLPTYEPTGVAPGDPAEAITLAFAAAVMEYRCEFESADFSTPDAVFNDRSEQFVLGMAGGSASNALRNAFPGDVVEALASALARAASAAVRKFHRERREVEEEPQT